MLEYRSFPALIVVAFAFMLVYWPLYALHDMLDIATFTRGAQSAIVAFVFAMLVEAWFLAWCKRRAARRASPSLK